MKEASALTFASLKQGLQHALAMAAGIVSIPIIISGPDAFRLRRYGGGYLHMTVVLKRRIHTYDGGGEEDDTYIG